MIKQKKINNEDDSVLLKIHRQFGEEESFRFLFSFIKHLKFRIGEQKSEIEELRHNNDYVRDKELKQQYADLNKKHMQVRRELEYYRSKYFTQIAKEHEDKSADSSTQSESTGGGTD